MATKLYIQETPGTYRQATTDEILADARHRINRQYRRGSKLTDQKMTIDYLFPKFAAESEEVFGVIYLDTRHRIIEYVPHFRGSITHCNVHARVILKHALKLNAAAAICCHNHPSGDAEPSSSDIRLTATIKELLKHIEVSLLDHVIIAGDQSLSMAARGLV